ncbi:hypothetical protein ACE38U_11335 [Cedecea sp. S5-13]|uniref:hypothetical protein n=1 Tax=Cedecea selenatireducens TaxID=3144416 RepID=UPI0035CCE0D8
MMLTVQLMQAGYISVTRPLALTSESKVWVARKGFTDFGSASQYYRPLQQQDTLLTEKASITWDTHYCAVTYIQDAAGAGTHEDYGYRFLTHNHLIDPNDNHQLVSLDAWDGRPALGSGGLKTAWRRGTHSLRQKKYLPRPDDGRRGAGYHHHDPGGAMSGLL